MSRISISRTIEYVNIVSQRVSDVVSTIWIIYNVDGKHFSIKGKKRITKTKLKTFKNTVLNFRIYRYVIIHRIIERDKSLVKYLRVVWLLKENRKQNGKCIKDFWISLRFIRESIRWFAVYSYTLVIVLHVRACDTNITYIYAICEKVKTNTCGKDCRSQGLTPGSIVW